VSRENAANVPEVTPPAPKPLAHTGLSLLKVLAAGVAIT